MKEMKPGPVKDSILDIAGEYTGIPLNRRLLISVAGTVVIYLALCLMPMEAYGDKCAQGLAFVCATIWWMITTPAEMSVSALLIATLGVLSGVLAYSDVTAMFGSSSFYTMLGMSIVARGIEFTPFGRRIAYWFLYRFGQRPMSMLIVFGVVTACLSAFVSNIAVIILMSSIADGLLRTMGEKPGESRFGRAMMTMVIMASLMGGMALINGSPIGNLQGIAFMNAASSELDLSISYADWAKISVPVFLITVVPSMLIYARLSGFRSSALELPGKDYFKGYLDSLGRIGGSEIRWLLLTAGMIACMLSGMNTALASLLFAALCMLPGIGISDCREVIKRLPWGVLLCVCMVPLIGTVITGTGVSDWLNDLLSPLLGGMGVLPLSMASCALVFLCMNLMVNCTHGAQALTITLSTTVCIGLGYNPCTVLMPAMFAGAWFWCIGANYIVMMNKGYGWWELRDTLLPGFATGAFLCIAVPLINYLLCPLWGLSFYI